SKLAPQVDSDRDGLSDDYENRIGTSADAADSDYDGRSDFQELVDGTDPVDESDVVQVKLGAWRFDSLDFSESSGQNPVLITNAVLVPSWHSNAVRMSAHLPASLVYP